MEPRGGAQLSPYYVTLIYVNGNVDTHSDSHHVLQMSGSPKQCFCPTSRAVESLHPCIWQPPILRICSHGHICLLSSFTYYLVIISLLLVFSREARFCLGEGSYSSSLGVPSTTLSVTGLLLHWPPAHQTSCLSQCPDLATALPIPASASPCLDKASFLQAPLLLTA